MDFYTPPYFRDVCEVVSAATVVQSLLECSCGRALQYLLFHSLVSSNCFQMLLFYLLLFALDVSYINFVVVLLLHLCG